METSCDGYERRNLPYGQAEHGSLIILFYFILLSYNLSHLIDRNKENTRHHLFLMFLGRWKRLLMQRRNWRRNWRRSKTAQRLPTLVGSSLYSHEAMLCSFSFRGSRKRLFLNFLRWPISSPISRLCLLLRPWCLQWRCTLMFC